MLTNDRFAAHTRSASFALQLSAAQIEYLLAAAKVRELAEAFPWYRPNEANFGTPEGMAVHWSTATVRSLARRGLVDVVPVPLPCCEHDVVRLTRAGELLVQLLKEAAFEVDPQRVPPVPLHPDDRTRLYFDGRVLRDEPAPPDRRAPADPELVPFLAGYRPTVTAPVVREGRSR